MNLKACIENNYKKSLQVVVLLDEVQLLDSKYRFVLNKAKDELVEKVMDNKPTFFRILQTQFHIHMIEYREFNNEEQEVLREEMYCMVENVIDDIIYDRFSRESYNDNEDYLDGFLGFM